MYLLLQLDNGYFCIMLSGCTTNATNQLYIYIPMVSLCAAIHFKQLIREYGSTLYVGMAPKKNGRPYNSIATNELKSLLIYTDMFKYTHTF